MNSRSSACLQKWKGRVSAGRITKNKPAIILFYYTIKIKKIKGWHRRPPCALLIFPKCKREKKWLNEMAALYPPDSAGMISRKHCRGNMASACSCPGTVAGIQETSGI